MAPHSSILAWKTPWADGPGGLQSMGVTEGQTQLSTNSSKEHPRMLSRQPSPVTPSPPSPRYSLFSMQSSERSF